MYSLDIFGHLKISNMELTSLDELPDGIRMLNCSYNHLDYLPELPEGIEDIICDHNNIKSLSLRDAVGMSMLPESVECINCSYNNIRVLPELPKWLRIFRCYNNPLECLIPVRFYWQQERDWMSQYYLPYIGSYEGQKNILTKHPEQFGELMEQTNILDSIMEEFEYLFSSHNLKLI